MTEDLAKVARAVATGAAHEWRETKGRAASFAALRDAFIGVAELIVHEVAINEAARDARIRREALEEVADCQPSTAQDPNESAYQRGRFDGIMEYAHAIRTLTEGDAT